MEQIPLFTRNTYYEHGLDPSSTDHVLSDSVYESILAPFVEDTIGIRRLVKRVFETRGNMNLCHEYVATRVSTDIAQNGWSLDRAVFHEGNVTPYPWHYNNMLPVSMISPSGPDSSHPKIVIPMMYVNDYTAEWVRMESLSTRHIKQDALSQL